MAPIILETDVCCYKCACKINDCIKNLLGVERVWASPDTRLVVVAGTADAALLRRRIRHRIRRHVNIVSDGEPPQPEQDDGRYYGMVRLPPPPPPRTRPLPHRALLPAGFLPFEDYPPYAALPPPGYPHDYSWEAAPPPAGYPHWDNYGHPYPHHCW